jgi:hypothetical protein
MIKSTGIIALFGLLFVVREQGTPPSGVPENLRLLRERR